MGKRAAIAFMVVTIWGCKPQEVTSKVDANVAIASLNGQGYQEKNSVLSKMPLEDAVSYLAWKQFPIPVCFEPGGNLDNSTLLGQDTFADPMIRRKETQRAVEREYGSAGIEFSGWQTCTPNSKGLRVWLNTTPTPQVKDFGVLLDGVPQGVTINIAQKFILNNSCGTTEGYLRCFRMMALHEFGHALGLAHEMERTDSQCAQGSYAGQETRHSVNFGNYDPNSIMDYCMNYRTIYDGVEASISPGDKEILRLMYKKPIEALIAARTPPPPAAMPSPIADVKQSEQTWRPIPQENRYGENNLPTNSIPEVIHPTPNPDRVTDGGYYDLDWKL